jgi:CHAT domain-containing protein
VKPSSIEVFEDIPSRCRDLLKTVPERDVHGYIRTQTLPFDWLRALALYRELFGQVEDLIRDKHLLIVPSGALTQLPFQVLVTKPPAGSDHRTIAWLARDHAITILPAVSSLKALRRVGKPSAARFPMIGFGNPLLNGPNADYAERAELARAKQHCPDTPRQQRMAAHVAQRNAAGQIARRNGRADPAHLIIQAPLPETADELCAVSRDINADPSEMRLGARATEHDLKSLSAKGELAKFRILHFATHGFLAGQLDGTNEPGLLLTPPGEATQDDDGYLSASEITGLKLDADWVVLSACNTAAGGAQGAEALSGLARAFFYAGARALLVSHWAVDSDATVKVITRTLSIMAADKTIGRSEALRQSMVALIDEGVPHQAHPAFWAPFVVVGEGAVGIGTEPSLAPVAASVQTGSVNPAPAVVPTLTKPAVFVPTTPTTTQKKTTAAKSRSRPKAADWKTTIYGR